MICYPLSVCTYIYNMDVRICMIAVSGLGLASCNKKTTLRDQLGHCVNGKRAIIIKMIISGIVRSYIFFFHFMYVWYYYLLLLFPLPSTKKIDGSHSSIYNSRVRTYMIHTRPARNDGWVSFITRTYILTAFFFGRVCNFVKEKKPPNSLSWRRVDVE